ncbi:tyrosine-type recombinase/integrase [Pseudomonas protegens]|uniref:tyrosine-type recombinase/integrase n=1 Tax=Pseudomonas protegens TaxID=380021 RepID=UPI0035CCDF20
MDLFYLTGQRIADTLKMDERDIRDGRLAVQQEKTKAKRRIEITGELKIVLDRIMARKDSHQFRSTRLIVLENGTPLTVAMLRRRFDLAREAAGVKKADFQMRYLRAKSRHGQVQS